MFYDKMKAKYQKEFNERMHWFELLNIMLTRFVWDGLPDTVPAEQLEAILIANGTCGFGKANGEYWVGDGGYQGDQKGFLPPEYMFTVTGIGDISGKVDKDIAVGWNNATRTPDFILFQFASILAEIDTSEKLNVLYTRHLRIPKVRDQKEKVAIESAIKALWDGKVDAIVSDNTHDARELLNDSIVKENNFLELSDVKDVDKLQYLYMYRNEIMTRFYKKAGLNSQFTNKPAQQNNDEIHANDDTAMIGYLAEFEYRKKFAEDINRIFGLNVSVRMSEASQDSYDEIINEETGGAEDETESVQSEEVL